MTPQRYVYLLDTVPEHVKKSVHICSVCFNHVKNRVGGQTIHASIMPVDLKGVTRAELMVCRALSQLTVSTLARVSVVQDASCACCECCTYIYNILVRRGEPATAPAGDARASLVRFLRFCLKW